MSVRSLQQGIEAVQNGHLEEGARLLRLAIRDETLAPHLKATAFAWLSNTQEDVAFKIECYQKAVASDPQNTTYAQHLNMLMAAQVPAPKQPAPPPAPATSTLPPPQPQTPTYTMPNPTSTNTFQQINPNTYTAPKSTNTGTYTAVNPNTGSGYQPPINDPYIGGGASPRNTGTFGSVGGTAITLNEPQRSVGVVGGPNGKGSGLFVTRDGLIATTRFVVGSEESLTIQLANGQTLAGRVLRSFPQYDLAFIKVPVQVVTLMTVAQVPILAENVPLNVLSHPGEMVRTSRRESRGELPSQWFPTLLNRLQDAGGNPIYDPQNALVGMMTRNSSRSTGYFYGLHISTIYQCVQQFSQESHDLNGHGVYCTSCGSSSRAGIFNAYYCETCGAILPPAIDVRRRPMDNVGALYGENMYRPCPNCRSTVGYYNGVCLRCGSDAAQRR